MSQTLYYIAKTGVSALVIVTVSEVAKRSSLFGALIAALPLTSLMAFVWMWAEKTEISEIAELSTSIFWLVIPSLLFFIIFPVLIHKGFSFWMSFALSSSVTMIAYALLSGLLKIFRFHL